MKAWEAIVGTGNPDSRLLIEPRTVEDQVPRLLLSVPKDHLQAPLDDVLSEVTIQAQVERIISAGNESYQVIRMLKGGPASSLEKESVAGTVPEMLPALSRAKGKRDAREPGLLQCHGKQYLLSDRGAPPGRNLAPRRLTHQIGRPQPGVP